MRPNNQHTAILFFTRSAKAEGALKQFTGGRNRRRNVRVAHSLIAHTHRQLRQTGLPVFLVDEKLQRGNTFGERLSNAFSLIFRKGYRNVIAVGNDTPELKSAHIHQADALLSGQKAQIVLGPADDGGTWLMGYSREAFRARSFQQLPWKSTKLLEAILNQIGDAFPVALLEPHGDIDNFASLKAFTGRRRFGTYLIPLVHKLRSIIGGRSLWGTPLNSNRLCDAPASTTRLLRAPPRTG